LQAKKTEESRPIWISFFGNLIRYRKHRDERSRQLALGEDWTLHDVVRQCGIDVSEIGIVSCNNERVSLDYKPVTGDHIKVFDFMSGG
jgi:sulfur carrier protein ThiS